MDAASEYVESSRELLADVPPRDRPGAARNLMVTAATAKDKALLVRGQPTQIVQRNDAAPLLRKLAAAGLLATDHVDGTAEELPAADGVGQPEIDSP